jgi:hypothetical protein
LAVSAVLIVLCFGLGGYVILPLQALVAQMSGRFRAELLGVHVKVGLTVCPYDVPIVHCARYVSSSS